MATCNYSEPPACAPPSVKVRRDPAWLGDANWQVPLRGTLDGNYNITWADARPSFWSLFDNWLLNMNHYSYWYGGYGMTTQVGHAGVGGCFGHVSNHDDFNAADVNKIWWANGTVLDIYNGAHLSSDRTTKRRYLAVSASLRKFFGYTLDGYLPDWNDGGAHNNHFHVDPVCPVTFNRQGSTRSKLANIAFVQAVCNEFVDAGIPDNHFGTWTTQTNNAWFDFTYETRTWCYNYEYSTSAWRLVLDMIMRHGFADRDAGYYKSGCGTIF